MEYSDGFEKFWSHWIKVTKRLKDKPRAYKYWVRDKLDGKEDKLIDSVNTENSYRKLKAKKDGWIEKWKICPTWLNQKCYENDYLKSDIDNIEYNTAMRDLDRKERAKKEAKTRLLTRYEDYIKTATVESLRSMWARMPHCQELIRELRPEIFITR